MAVDLGASCLTGNFDLYCIFIELIFGDLTSAFFGILLIIFLIGAVTKTNILTISTLMIMFSVVYLTMWYGGVMVMIVFIASFLWFVFSLFNLLKVKSAG